MSIVNTEELVHLLNRRGFLAGSAALAAVPLMPWVALAQSGSYSFKQGKAEVIVVSDGTLNLPLNVLAPEASPEQLAEIAKRLGWGNQAEVAANAVVIKSGAEIVLLDTGSGKNQQPTAGKLQENLAAAGIDPASITKVVFTHAHPDHISGTMKQDGTLLAPNAAYYAGEGEWNFWTAADLLSKMPPEMGDVVRGAQANLGAVKDRVTMLKGGSEIVPGLAVIETFGHSPGHLSFQVAGAEGLIITADAAVNEVVSFEHPEWRFAFDAIPEQAVQSRKALLDQAANEKSKLLGYHWAFPGVGYAEKKGTAYRFVKS